MGQPHATCLVGVLSPIFRYGSWGVGGPEESIDLPRSARKGETEQAPAQGQWPLRWGLAEPLEGWPLPRARGGASSSESPPAVCGLKWPQVAP